MRKLFYGLLLFVFSAGIAYAASNNSGLHSLYQPAGNSVLGNPNGQVTVVEFFDYNCGYCRMMFPKVNQLASQDKNVRIIFREYPILSDRSTLPAEAALAAQKQGKYIQMHDAMMSAMQPLDQTEIVKLAQGIGLNTTKLLQDMQSSSVNNQIQKNLAMGGSMNIQGVPTFIVARTSPPSKQQPDVVVGPSYSQLQNMITEAQSS